MIRFKNQFYSLIFKVPLIRTGEYSLLWHLNNLNIYDNETFLYFVLKILIMSTLCGIMSVVSSSGKTVNSGNASHNIMLLPALFVSRMRCKKLETFFLTSKFLLSPKSVPLNFPNHLVNLCERTPTN